MCGPRTVPPANAEECLVPILYTAALFESHHTPQSEGPEVSTSFPGQDVYSILFYSNMK